MLTPKRRRKAPFFCQKFTALTVRPSMLETDTAARSADVFDTSLPLVLRKKSRAKFDESTARHADFFSAVGTLLGNQVSH